MLGISAEDYLKNIYKLESEHKKVTTSAIAQRMGVSNASVTSMLKKLSKLNLVEHSPYHGTTLTSAGQKMALEIIRHHRLIELYLSEAMGVAWDKVHEEADRWEHVLSEELEDKMAEILGQPERDPHGAPIPSKNGDITADSYVTLAEVEPGQRAIIRRVSDKSSERLKYIGELGLYPEVEVLVVARAPFEGPVSILVEDCQMEIGVPIARDIMVEIAGRVPRGNL